MATSKTLTPTNVTIQIPAFADKPDQRLNSNCLDKEADAINALSDQIATYSLGTVSSLDNLQTAITTYANSSSMADNQSKNFVFTPSFASDYFVANSTYFGTVVRITQNRFSIIIQNHGDKKNVVRAVNANGTWSWDKFALDSQVENKANGGGVSWGTSFTVNLSKNVGYLFVNHDLRIQIWLTGEGISISTSYNSGTNVYGFTKSVSGNTISFSGTDPNGNAFTITKNGSTVTITKSTAGAMLIVC